MALPPPLNFDPNATATADSGLFGLSYSRADARLCVLPVPWEVTTSYGDGASRGPMAVLEASRQIDLFDIETGDVYRHGLWMAEEESAIRELNYEMKRKAFAVIEVLEAGSDDQSVAKNRTEINEASAKINAWVYKNTRDLLADGKLVGVVGGDHSSPFGAIRAVSEKCAGDFGILHVDAHADLRDAYQGFQHSHASIMFNVMESAHRPKHLVQMGIRDFSQGEYAYISKHADRITTYFDPLVKRRLNRGESWQKICDEALSKLPKNVYVSFDIDGLEPGLCPHTGTPVPGGLSFDQATTLLASIHEAGKTIVGFDLCEVAQPEGVDGEWDGNVGARLLFKLCGWTLISNGFETSER